MNFLASEDELIGVEHLLAEPKCNGIFDCILGFDTFNSPKCFNIEELPAVEYGYMKTDGDALPSSLSSKSEGTKNEFFDDKYEEANDGLSHGIYKLPDTCEDYLLDTEFDDNVSDFNYVPSKGSCGENLYQDYQSAGLGGRQCGAEIVELSTASIPIMLEATCDQKSSLLNEPLTGVFNFRTKPRGRHVKRGRKLGSDFLKSLSSEDREVVFGLQDVVEKESVLVTRRLRTPTQRCSKVLIEQNSRFQKRKCRISDTISKNKVLHIGQNGSRPAPLFCWNEPYESACIQDPFGCPVEKRLLKTMVHKTPDCKDNRLWVRGSRVDSDKEPYPAESEDDTSEDDHLARTETHKYKIRRKHHVLWSLPEVLKLVEGVSRYGVGRWTEIKRVLFPSSEHRTSVDLKDKWRNLLRSSCLRSQSKRGVERKRKQHAINPIPKHILQRVRELAMIYPYPRERKTQQVSQSLFSLQ